MVNYLALKAAHNPFNLIQHQEPTELTFLAQATHKNASFPWILTSEKNKHCPTQLLSK